MHMTVHIHILIHIYTYIYRKGYTKPTWEKAACFHADLLRDYEARVAAKKSRAKRDVVETSEPAPARGPTEADRITTRTKFYMNQGDSWRKAHSKATVDVWGARAKDEPWAG